MYRIGIWNTAFLGDAILTLPLIQNLRLAWPDAELHFWVRKGLAELFKAHPDITHVHEFDKHTAQRGFFALRKQARKLRFAKYDLWISPHKSFRSGLLARMSGIPVRVGYDSPIYNKLFYTHTVPRNFYQDEEIERLLNLLEPLDIAPESNWPNIALSPAALEHATGFWEAYVKGPVLGVHPGSTWSSKQWPTEYFGETINRALRHGVQVLLFGGPEEKELAARVLDCVDKKELQTGRVINLAGALTLPELAAFINRLDCYLTNDSGPMHLAWPQNTPLVALFGPTVRELGFFPRGTHATVMEQDLDCRPCGLHGGKACKKGHHDCMEQLSPQDVWHALREHLKHKLPRLA